MTRFLCIHGHFYQPPRENPWLEAIELQDSAYPYHDWNDRVTDECYAPNAASRILGEHQRISAIVNNYSRISFNIGPTLLHWLEAHRPQTYAAIIQADRDSRARFSGHGSAIAQAYNHVILPLASREDKVTQIRWGMRDFEHRFGRKPEGMWLPEAAVDVESLDIMAEHGLRYTILAPHQAAAFRRAGETKWGNASNGTINPRMPYTVNLPSGRSVAVFFYDGPTSRAVAFEDLLKNGEQFANRLLGLFTPDDGPQLVHIATDGETYGHHHRHGDMALAYALDFIEASGQAELTNYGELLEKHPPTHEATIIENSSWSCAHGIERWRSDCGCSTGGRPGWTQAWRGPLRDALDHLHRDISSLYQNRAGMLFKDPWEARNEYIDVILDRSTENVDAYLARHGLDSAATEDKRVEVLRVLEMARHAMLMYTSCGWFFSELSGIETVQVIQYAGRAIQLAKELGDHSLEAAFLSRLERAKSNVPAHQDGRVIFEKFVRPAMVDLVKVAAHYGISSLFDGVGTQGEVYCFDVNLEDHALIETGKTRLGYGRAQVRSRITSEKKTVTFGVLHMGDHNVSGGVREFAGPDKYEEMVEEIKAAFERAEFSEMIQLFDKHFGGSTYSLRSLFRDEQRRISNVILQGALDHLETVQREFYKNNLPLMRFLVSVGVPMPSVFHSVAQFVVNSELRRALETMPLDTGSVAALIEEAESLGIDLDQAGHGYAVESSFDRGMSSLVEHPDDIGLLASLAEAGRMLGRLPFEVDLWRAQNDYFELRERHLAAHQEKSAAGDETSSRWVSEFLELGSALNIQV